MSDQLNISEAARRAAMAAAEFYSPNEFAKKLDVEDLIPIIQSALDSTRPAPIKADNANGPMGPPSGDGSGRVATKTDLWEKADELIKRAAGAPLKPVFREVDYPYHYGQLCGGIKILEVYLGHPELLSGPVRELVELERELSAAISEQHKQNMEALT